MIIRILPDEILLVKVRHCSPQGKFPFKAKNYRIFYDQKYATKLPHLDPVYENGHKKRYEKRYEIRHEK